MWRPWGKSSTNKDQQQQHQHNFRCSSFKDIENLCNVDNNFNNNVAQSPTTPKNPPRRSIFHRVRTANTLLRQWPTRPDHPPDPSTRIIVYYTSLRVIRPTFEACRSVMSILEGFQILLDERDLAMDLGFMSELRELLGLKPNEDVALPRVFIGGRYIGGADEILRLHEIGELKKLVSGVPRKRDGTCDTCGGYRFVVCHTCGGSHKSFSEKVGFRACKDCNENGLVRCPVCYPIPLNRPILAPIVNES